MVRAAELSCLIMLMAIMGASAQNATAPTTIYEALQADGNFTTLVTAIDAAGLKAALSNETSTLTLFAPTNAAFNFTMTSLNVTANQLVANATLLTQVLSLHVLRSAVNSSNVPEARTNLGTLAGAAGTRLGLVLSQPTPGSVVVESTGTAANVTGADIAAGSSFVHAIDRVLVPFYVSVASAAVKNNLTALEASLNATKLLTTFANANFVGTVFAPTNAAFAAAATDLGGAEVLANNTELLKRILQLHVVAGSALEASDLTNGTAVKTLLGVNVTVVIKGTAVGITSPGGTAQVIVADVPVVAGRAVVHVISSVLLPFYTSIARALRATPGTATILAAAAAVNYTETLQNTTTSLTVLAPTDAAFAAALSSLNLNETQLLGNADLLAAVLNDHIIEGAVLSSALTNRTNVTTLSGKTLTVRSAGGNVFFRAANGGNEAQVSNADIEVGVNRSVVHQLNAVLLDPTLRGVPPGSSRAPTVAPSPSAAGAPNSGNRSTPAGGSASVTVAAPLFVTLLASLAAVLLL